MENKPIITCHGDQKLFASLHQLVVQGLPKETVDWRRSYGRPPRTINVQANFVPFNPNILPGDEDYTLLGRPFFHTYWTDCDVDTYKAMVREDIADWMGDLKAKNAADWLIIVVVHDENKVKTKLLRQSVLDKVRSDFCSKQTERCIVLTEPFRNDSRSSESWHQLLTRMRQLLLYSYNRHLSQFEEYMRAQRERRVEATWSFTQYFLLQEELAFMFEMLGLFEDALVQYDELDALFTQFVLNHAAGESATWLSTFMSNKVISWDGLCLSQPINIDKRQLIKHSKASLLDFRNYLFSRQCTLLFLMLRPWEVAQRAIPFLHNCIKELSILELTLPPGAIACWVFLSCLEVLNTCEKTTEQGQVEVYSLHTANLWNYARHKMQGLGVLCGLMPETNTTSQHLNLVVELISGMSQKEGESMPLKKLKEALSSKQAFTKHYMELSELAMGTYKHIGRIRSARLIGIDLADFYMKLGEPQKAEGFLMDALKMYRQEGWDSLLDNTRLKLAACQKVLPNSFKYMKTCLHIAASQVHDVPVRLEHFEEAMSLMKKLDEEEVHHLRTKPNFHIHQIQPANEEFVINTEVSVELVITNNLVKPLNLDEVVLSIVSVTSDKRETESKKNEDRHRNPSICSDLDVESVNKLNGWVLLPEVLDIETQYDYESDKSLASTSMVCRTVLRRADSSIGTQDGEVVKKEFDKVLRHDPLVLYPGKSNLTLSGKLTEVGTMQAVQLCLKAGNLEFLKSVTGANIRFKVVSEEPSIEIMKPEDGTLIAGIPQKLKLHLNSGTYSFGEDCNLKISSDQNLEISGQGFADGILNLSKVMPHQDLQIDIEVLAPIKAKIAQTFDVELTMQGDWLDGEHREQLTFKHPMYVTHKLRTIANRKFVQVIIQGTTSMDLKVSDHQLSTEAEGMELINLYKKKDPLIFNKDISVSYMWEVKDSDSCLAANKIEVLFSISYQTATNDEKRTAEFAFNVDLNKTLYIVESAVKSPDKEKSCKVGSSCQLQVTVTPSEKNRKDTVLYEVVTDSVHWCIAGKTSGILKFEGSEQVALMDVVPLVGGFLPLPSVKLHKCLDQNSPENMDIPELSNFPRGQVYNRSAASQVRVLPAATESQIDIA